eukprot:m.356781 g.356781  ORF g.356781 m.356781 type:complete len:166 (+) comp28020_c0_seq38:930-1427(+)
MARELKDGEEKCDVVVAITHNRLANDELLSDSAPSIDLILGGHDHEPAWKLKKRIVKSGDNFKYLSMVTIEIAANGQKPNGQKKLTCEVDRIDPTDDSDPQMEKLVKKWVAIPALTSISPISCHTQYHNSIKMSRASAPRGHWTLSTPEVHRLPGQPDVAGARQD